MMIFYRLVRDEYKEDISGYGSYLYGGRWNSKGLYALYCAEFISLTVLEIVVNYERGLYRLRPDYYLTEIQMPDISIIDIDGALIKKHWKEDFEYTRFIGDQFLQSKASLALKIPSAVIPEEHNLLINPNHPDFKKLKVINSKLYDVDKRLF